MNLLYENNHNPNNNGDNKWIIATIIISIKTIIILVKLISRITISINHRINNKAITIIYKNVIIASIMIIMINDCITVSNKMLLLITIILIISVFQDENI